MTSSENLLISIKNKDSRDIIKQLSLLKIYYVDPLLTTLFRVQINERDKDTFGFSVGLSVLVNYYRSGCCKKRGKKEPAAVSLFLFANEYERGSKEDTMILTVISG